MPPTARRTSAADAVGDTPDAPAPEPGTDAAAKADAAADSGTRPKDDTVPGIEGRERINRSMARTARVQFPHGGFLTGPELPNLDAEPTSVNEDEAEALLELGRRCGVPVVVEDAPGHQPPHGTHTSTDSGNQQQATAPADTTGQGA